MPLVKCSKDGKSGWKWGEKNTSCFTGPHARRDAIKQAIVIEGGPEKFKKAIKSKGNELDNDEIEQAIAELIEDGEIDRYDYYAESALESKTEDNN